MDKLQLIKNKIINLNDLKNKKAYWKFREQKVVFTNGCFDIIHRGHIEYLLKAASYGDILIVGLNTDESIRKIKGDNRPIMDEESRAMTLASLQFVNFVVLFKEETPLSLINSIVPDVLIKGSDYKKEDIIGYDIVKNAGGKIITIDFIEGYSTTSIINKIKNS
ncbi:D-glycero-beta-D-manno-heptose 1-phosphate adenylyltransferase [Bacteroidota bacterium]